MTWVDRMVRVHNLVRDGNRRKQRVNEEIMIARYIPEGVSPKAMYDMGVGVFQEFITLKLFYPEMELFGCEPCPGEYQELQKLFNGALLPIAIGETPGKTTLYASKLGIGGSTTIYHPGRSGMEEIEVDVWTLDQFDEWAGKPSDILLWMDIEGRELDALKGGTQLLSSGRVNWLNLETRNVDNRGDEYPTTKKITEYLEGFGYDYIHRYNVQGAYPEAPGDVIYFKQGLPLAEGKKKDSR